MSVSSSTTILEAPVTPAPEQVQIIDLQAEEIEELKLLKKIQAEQQKKMSYPMASRSLQVRTAEDPKEQDARSVFVQNVDYDVTTLQLEAVFSSQGSVKRVTIPTDPYTGQPKGFGYVEFEKVADVQSAMKLTGTVLNGRKIAVVPKRTNVPRATTSFQQTNGRAFQRVQGSSVYSRDNRRMLLLYLLALFGSSLAVVDEHSRVDCFPEPGASQTACQQRGCVWQAASPSAPIGTPYCYFPRESGYKVLQQNVNYYQLTEGFANPYGSNISPIDVKVGNIGKTLTVSIGTSARYVPPVNFPKNPTTSTDQLQFKATKIPNTDFFAFQVTRASTGIHLFDTSIGGMQFSDQFIQIATFLPSANLFGFGDHIHQRLKHDLSRYTVWPMFARDIAPDSSSPLSTQNLYGVHPFYIVMENDGNAHGVMILNSNAQEVMTGPGPHLIYRTIGGQLDISFFPGPTPEQVVQQYLTHIGTPFLPAYWALGYQLCRWGYADLAEMQTVIARVQAAGIPLDVPYADIDYMSHYEDFTEGTDWSGFPAYAAQLHQQGLHLILIFDPAIEVDYGTFQRALTQNARFIEWATAAQVPHSVQDQYPMAKDTLVMLGNVWPDRNTAFPDFLDPTNNTANWWSQEFQRFHGIVGFDGIWIDMNEPSNFDTDTYSTIDSRLSAHLSCPIQGADAVYDMPPYQTYAVFNRPGEYLCSKTLCMLGKTAGRTQNFYDTKNLYGWSEARATSKALRETTGKRGAVISRSTFPSSGRYGGHWLGDNSAHWADLKTSVIGAMEFNFFGIPYVGSDICGFNGPTTEELCLRWHQMGAFHSFSRNHNTKGDPPQDPAVWPTVAAAARIALGFRYQYLPYLYSLHYNSARFGGTVVRPLFFEFPTDSTTQEIDYQFMWGRAFMIAPAVDQGMTSVHAYFPSATWYSLVPETYGVQMDVGYDDVAAKTDSLTPVYVRGGFVIPRQASNTTTTQSRLNPMEVLIAMPSDASASVGELYWDGGDDLYDDINTHKRHHWTFTYTVSTTGAALSGTCDGCDASVLINPLNTVEILGYDYTPDFNTFQLDGNKVSINVQTSSYSAIRRRMVLSTASLVPLQKYAGSGMPTFRLSWSHRSNN